MNNLPDICLEYTYLSCQAGISSHPGPDWSTVQWRSSPRSPRLTHLDSPPSVSHFANAPVDPWRRDFPYFFRKKLSRVKSNKLWKSFLLRGEIKYRNDEQEKTERELKKFSGWIIITKKVDKKELLLLFSSLATVSRGNQSFPWNKYSKLLRREDFRAMFAFAEKLLIQKTFLASSLGNAKVCVVRSQSSARGTERLFAVDVIGMSTAHGLGTRARMSTMTLHWTREPRKANEKR